MSELIKLDPGAIKKAEWMNDAAHFVSVIKSYDSVDNDENLKEAGKLQTAASKHIKALEKIRKEVKQPALDFGREVDAQAKEMRAPLETEIARIKKLNGDYATKKAQEAEAERQRIAEAEAAKVEAEPVFFGGLELPANPELETPSAPLPSGKVKTGANAMVTVWEFDITNPKLVPAEFLTVDEKKVREFMNYKAKMGETPKVDGIVFRSRVDVRAR